MYAAFVIAHSWLRWLVLVLVVVALARAIARRRKGSPWRAGDEAAGRWFVISLDVQVLIGLVLSFFLSPITTAAWSNLGGAMGDPALRFITVEHLAGMIAATAFAHVGRVRIRKAADDMRRHTQALIFYGVSLLLILVSIPWPFMGAGRPLFRGM